MTYRYVKSLHSTYFFPRPYGVLEKTKAGDWIDLLPSGMGENPVMSVKVISGWMCTPMEMHFSSLQFLTKWLFFLNFSIHFYHFFMNSRLLIFARALIWRHIFEEKNIVWDTSLWIMGDPFQFSSTIPKNFIEISTCFFFFLRVQRSLLGEINCGGNFFMYSFCTFPFCVFLACV